MRESIRPVAGAIGPLALMGVRCFGPHNMIGRGGLVVDQAPEAAVLADEPSVFTSHSFLAFGAVPAGNGYLAAYSSFRASSAHAILAVLLASATIVRLKPRLASSFFSHSER